MILYKLLGIGDDEGKVAATAGTGHLPGEDIGDIAVIRYRLSNIAIGHWILAVSWEVRGLDHAGEHGGLGIEGGFVGGGEGGEVALEDG